MRQFPLPYGVLLLRHDGANSSLYSAGWRSHGLSRRGRSRQTEYGALAC